jgi:hypothetical protein
MGQQDKTSVCVLIFIFTIYMHCVGTSCHHSPKPLARIRALAGIKIKLPNIHKNGEMSLKFWLAWDESNSQFVSTFT